MTRIIISVAGALWGELERIAGGAGEGDFGEPDVERGAYAHLTPGGEAAAVQVDYLLADGETEAAAPGSPRAILVDPIEPVEEVRQVLLNLLDNAIKYSDPGSRVHVRMLRDADAVTVRVSDTGAGIPEEDLPHLFDRFYRVNKDRSRATGGSGLGLAISKQIIDLHVGRLSARSEVGVGSTFDVWLPKVPLPRSAGNAL